MEHSASPINRLCRTITVTELDAGFDARRHLWITEVIIKVIIQLEDELYRMNEQEGEDTNKFTRKCIFIL